VARHDGERERLRNLSRIVGTLCFLTIVGGFVLLKPYPVRKKLPDGVRVTLKAPKPLAEKAAAVPPPPVAPPPVTAQEPPRLPKEFFRERPLQPLSGRGPEERAPARRAEPPPDTDSDPEPIVRDVDPEQDLPPAAPPPPPKQQPAAKSSRLPNADTGRANCEAVFAKNAA
jgi:hypothetical protein